MSEIFRYKGFMGSIETSTEDMCLHGKLLFINDTVTYEAKNLKQLQKEFEDKLTEIEIEEAIVELKRKGDIYEPRKGYISRP